MSNESKSISEITSDLFTKSLQNKADELKVKFDEKANKILLYLAGALGINVLTLVATLYVAFVK